MQPWTKINWTDAQQVLELVDARARGNPDPAANGAQPHAYLAKLREAGKLTEAVKFIGHALPRYESVVWAARCLLGGSQVDRTDPVINAVLRWIDDPCDELRREAEARATQADNSPAKLLGQAVFMSGGSISLADLPPVLPPPDACAKYTVTAVLIDADRQSDPLASLAVAIDTGCAIAINGAAG